MEEMRVYVANLGKYNEGELVGAWFEPPIDYDEMAERIGLNEFYEEYAIHDYELPFDIEEYTPIEEVNRLCEMVADLPEYVQDNLKELQGYFSSLEDLCEHQDDRARHGDYAESRNKLFFHFCTFFVWGFSDFIIKHCIRRAK